MQPIQIFEKVREQVNDVGDPPIWKDDRYFKFLLEFLQLMFDHFPESRIDSTGALSPWVDYEVGVHMTTDLWLGPTYLPAAVAYLAYRFFSADAGDTRDNDKAQLHLRSFSRLVGRAF